MDGIQQQLALFGARLRDLRLQRGLTLQEVAVRSKLSRAFLSRLESGGRQASISAALATLFEFPASEPVCAIVRSGGVVESSVNGLKYVPLSDARRFFNMQPMRVKVSPSRRGNEHYHHEGTEWLYVLRGKLTLSLVGKTYDLEEGDAAHFESRLPHRLMARGGREAEVLLVAAPNGGAANYSGINEHRSIPAGGFLYLPKGETTREVPAFTKRDNRREK